MPGGQRLVSPAMTPKILVLPGSFRSDSFNVRLAAVAALELARQGADVTRVSLADYPLPIIDRDLRASERLPDTAMQLGRMVAAQDGVFIATPEYNASIPPLVKNAIDWVSRIRRDRGRPVDPWRGKAVGLASASCEPFGGARALCHLRAVMAAVGAEAVCEECIVTDADAAFAADGSLVDERGRSALTSTCRSLIRHAAVFGRPDR